MLWRERAAAFAAVSFLLTAGTISYLEVSSNQSRQDQKRRYARMTKELFATNRNDLLAKAEPFTTLETVTSSTLESSTTDESLSPTNKIRLPAWTDGFADVRDVTSSTDTPFFWYVPKAGSSTIVKIFANCLGLAQASDKGQATMDPKPQVIQVEGVSKWPFKPRYLNVKTHIDRWIDICKSRRLVESGLVDVFVTQLLVKASQLFSSNYRARGVAMFRHPVKRLIDQFYNRQQIARESNADSAMATISLEDFATGDKMVENEIVRTLNDIGDEVTVTADHVEVAKEILRRKFLVLVYESFDKSVTRMEKYFEWWDWRNVGSDSSVSHCHQTFFLSSTHGQIENHPKTSNVDNVYKTIMSRNWADFELYQYAKTLFDSQADLVQR